MADTDVLILRCGGRWNFWTAHVDAVARFVDAHVKNLNKVKVAVQAPVMTPAEVASKVLIWDGSRGGIRIPHLHYAGEVYALNDAQWADFSKSAMSALTAKMGAAQKVPFENLMQISEGMVGM